MVSWCLLIDSRIISIPPCQRRAETTSTDMISIAQSDRRRRGQPHFCCLVARNVGKEQGCSVPRAGRLRTARRYFGV